MDWHEIPETIDTWALEVAAPAWDLRQAAARVPTGTPVGYYVDPGAGRVALHGAGGPTPADLALCKAAASTLGLPVTILTAADLARPDSTWIKVAYSHAVRRLGELLNFFPGQYPGGLPNAPSPLAAMLTSGLVGAGLGWGGGKLLQGVLPGGYGRRLPRTGALLGALPGVALGGLWGAAARQHGHGFTDPWPLNTPAGAPPEPDTASWHAQEGLQEPRHTFATYLDDLPARQKTGAVLGLLDALPQPARLREIMDKMEKLGEEEFSDTIPGDVAVNTNALGQVLWRTGASPALAGATMGALYAAQQMPDPQSRPGFATANQLGQLAMATAGDYARGAAAGALLNLVIGTPLSASRYGAGAAVLGLIGAVVPRLYGH